MSKLYDCQRYDPARLCRYDRRAIDRGCDGCKRNTDRIYLIEQCLWIAGVSHNETDAIQDMRDGTWHYRDHGTACSVAGK